MGPQTPQGGSLPFAPASRLRSLAVPLRALTRGPHWLKGPAAWFWKELEREVLANVVVENTYAASRSRMLELQASEQGSRPLRWCPNPLRKLRATLLYTLNPFDRSMWAQISWPLFWLLTGVMLFPFYGVQPIAYLVLFVLMDKGDEYQLISFILSFKGFQAITLGAFTGLFAGAKLQWCTTHSTCDHPGITGAPGMERAYWFTTVCFVLNVLLVWASFVLLPLSEQKGAPNFIAEQRDPEQGRPASAGRRLLPRLSFGRSSIATLLGPAQGDTEPCCCGCAAFNPRRGGALRVLLLWDLGVFVLIALLCAYAFLTQEKGWRLRSWLFWGRVAYGLASVPFLMFLVPPFDRVLVHTWATGYDQRGRCRGRLTLRDRQLLKQIHQAAATSDGSGPQLH